MRRFSLKTPSPPPETEVKRGRSVSRSRPQDSWTAANSSSLTYLQQPWRSRKILVPTRLPSLGIWGRDSPAFEVRIQLWLATGKFYIYLLSLVKATSRVQWSPPMSWAYPGISRTTVSPTSGSRNPFKRAFTLRGTENAYRCKDQSAPPSEARTCLESPSPFEENGARRDSILMSVRSNYQKIGGLVLLFCVCAASAIA